MTLGFNLLMADAIIVLSRENIFKLLKYEHEKLIRKHWILNFFGGVCIIIGLTTIIIHKNNKQYPHFTSFHSIIGLTAVVLFFIGCLYGLITLYSSYFQSLIKPFKIKFTHVCIGIITFVLGIFAQCTGLYSHFFSQLLSSNEQLTCIILVLIASLIPFEGAFRSAYSKYKNLVQGWPEDTSSIGR